MRLAVLGANGMVGSRVAAEAVQRGHQVTAVTRSGPPTVEGVDHVAGAADDPAVIAELAAGHDAIVSAIGPSRTGGDHQEFLDALKTLTDNAGASRVLVVGGAGSLLVGDGVRLVDAPGFPDAYKPEALTQGAALDQLRAGGGNWTYLSPAPMLVPGERTGSYTTGTDSPVGESISAEDFAVAVVDELENPQHQGQRFTVAN